MARLVAQGLTEALGRPVIVENRPGVSGNIAAGDVVRAAPDGYAFLVSPTSVETANPSLFKATFDPTKDLTAVAGIGRAALYLVARPTLGSKNAKDLVSFAKAHPNKLLHATAGVGTVPQLAGELLERQAGITAMQVHHRGIAPALADVMAGHADFTFSSGMAYPHIRTGKVNLLGVTGTRRSSFFPDTPTLGEQGISGTELEFWFGMWAPNGTPPAVLARMADMVAKVLAQPDLRQRFAEMLGAEPAMLRAASFRKLLVEERALLSALIRDRGIKVDPE
jgi:tripartite-type tricarboxylate transporter receptor subunit TctC